MTPRERRGKRLFLIVATLLILEQLANVGFAFSHGLAEVKWFKSVAQPLGLVVAVACLWQGEIWFRWLVGAMEIFTGGLQVYFMTHTLAFVVEKAPPEKADVFLRVLGAPIGLIGVFGLLHVLAGLLLLFSPSMLAFFRYQRHGPQWWIHEAEWAAADE